MSRKKREANVFDKNSNSVDRLYYQNSKTLGLLSTMKIVMMIEKIGVNIRLTLNRLKFVYTRIKKKTKQNKTKKKKTKTKKSQHKLHISEARAKTKPSTKSPYSKFLNT